MTSILKPQIRKCLRNFQTSCKVNLKLVLLYWGNLDFSWFPCKAKRKWYFNMSRKIHQISSKKIQRKQS